jgi:hypothetical protein
MSTSRLAIVQDDNVIDLVNLDPAPGSSRRNGMVGGTDPFFLFRSN